MYDGLKTTMKLNIFEEAESTTLFFQKLHYLHFKYVGIHKIYVLYKKIKSN